MVYEWHVNTKTGAVMLVLARTLSTQPDTARFSEARGLSLLSGEETLFFVKTPNHVKSRLAESDKITIWEAPGEDNERSCKISMEKEQSLHLSP